MLNIKKAYANLKKYMEKKFVNCKIEGDTSRKDFYSIGMHTIYNNVEMFVAVALLELGEVVFSTTLGEIERTEETLSLINDFNAKTISLYVFINEEGKLEFRNNTYCNDASLLKTYLGKTLIHIVSLIESKKDKEFVKLLKIFSAV